MGLAFLSPLAALIVLVGVVPLATLAVVGRRARRARRLLGLDEPGSADRLAVPVAIAAVAVLLALAAAQPTLRDRRTQKVRTDAEVWVVLDTSRSMLARLAPGQPTRLERARAFAHGFRVALRGVPIGLASLTDRVLPDLFPSPDLEAFDTTLRGSIGIEKPPPTQFLRTRVSTLIPLTDVRSTNFFAPTDARRLLVVLTDGESQIFSTEKIGRELAAPPKIDTILVQFWNPGEKVYSNGQPEAAYRPDPSSGTTLRSLAAAAGGAAYGETKLGAVVEAARRDLASGRTESVGEERSETRLAPWVSLAAILPLSFVLWRRNLT
jgi:hypothetical protein